MRVQREAEAATPFRKVHAFRVRYAEVDPQSVVFNSRYLEYADIVLTEYMRALGLPLAGEGAPDIQVVHADLQYRSPLRFDDEVEGWARVARIGRSSIGFDVELRRSGASEPNAQVRVDYVHVDFAAGRSSEIPAELRARFLGAAGD